MSWESSTERTSDEKPFPYVALRGVQPPRNLGEVGLIVERVNSELNRMQHNQAELFAMLTPILADEEKPRRSPVSEADAPDRPYAVTPLGKQLEEFAQTLIRLNNSMELVMSLARL